MKLNVVGKEKIEKNKKEIWKLEFDKWKMEENGYLLNEM